LGDGPDQLNQTGKEKQKDETIENDGFRVDQVNFTEQVDMPGGDCGQGADNDQESDQHMDQGASTSGFREFHGKPPMAVR
jgi:hypothetical protein